MTAQKITEADRTAARELREVLADLSGFWYRLEDDGPLCAALARHRVEAEQRVLGGMALRRETARAIEGIEPPALFHHPAPMLRGQLPPPKTRP